MRNFARASAAVLLTTIAALGTIAMPASAEEPAAVSEADLTYFYKMPSPELAGRLVAHFDALRAAEQPGARPPLIGFFAAAFQRYPTDIDKMIPGSLSPQMLDLLAVSLHLAGQQAKAESLIGKLKARDVTVTDLAGMPASLQAVEATGPSEWDLLWGASFATGDPRFCTKILKRFADAANAGENADDLLRLVRDKEEGRASGWIVDKRGKDAARELIIDSTALWALNSNARQHAFVRTLVNEFVMAHRSEPAARALVALAGEYGHYALEKLVAVSEAVPGKPSVTINIRYFNQILDDLQRHAGSYPPHFEFPDDQPRAAHDVARISELLDPLMGNFSNNPPMLLRLAVLHSIGHHLDVPDSFPKAVAAFDKLLTLTPEDPQANYRYGSFLAVSTRKGEGIPFLEKARSLGVADADYFLGWSYYTVGNKAKAIENLEAYTKRVPGDARTAALLDAIRHDRVQVKETPGQP
ncbi:MAG TPA: hypothetical protein VN750_17465 [Steroidobacteraceae bacterium]|nr:hypothetical protein [Steroidobacteraceae bacterium]